MNPTAEQGAASPTLLFQRRERNVFLHILTACNLSCPHCYINMEQQGQRQIRPETMEAWLRLFHRPDRATNVIFLGGEPTMHRHLARGIAYARELGYSTVTVDTNGYLFHDLLDHISPGDAVLSFSIDGPDPAVNDPLRGEGVFDLCVANLKRAIDRGFDVSVIYTVQRSNLAHLHRMPALLEGLGVRRFFIQVIGIRGDAVHVEQAQRLLQIEDAQHGAAPADDAAAEARGIQLTYDEWLTVVPPVARDAARRGMHVIYPKVFLDPDEPFTCAGLDADDFFVFPNGRVYLCPLGMDHPIHSFEIVEDALKPRDGITERDYFTLKIPEGCVINKLLQGDNIPYDEQGQPRHRISCCIHKNQIRPGG